MRLAECLESLGLNDYQKLRLELAARNHEALLRAGWSEQPVLVADTATAHAEALLDELGIPDPDLT